MVQIITCALAAWFILSIAVATAGRKIHPAVKDIIVVLSFAAGTIFSVWIPDYLSMQNFHL